MAIIPTGKASEIRVTRSEWKGVERIDIRKYYLTDDPQEEMKPTHKGISLTVDQAEKVLEALKEILGY